MELDLTTPTFHHPRLALACCKVAIDGHSLSYSGIHGLNR